MRPFKIVFVAFVFGVALLGWGQDTPGAPPPAPAPTAQPLARAAAARRLGIMRVLRQLNLAPDQKTQVRSLLQTQRRQVQAIRQNASLVPAEKQSQIKQVRQSTHQQVLGILTPEQQAKLKAIQQRRHALAALNLTPEQRAKLQPIRQQMRQDVLAVRQDGSLTPEQKQNKIRDIRQNAMAQMKGVLTPEQQQRLEQMRPRRDQPSPPPAPESF